MLNKLPLEKIFRTALKNGGTFSDIFYECTVETGVVADNNKIERAVSGSDIGLGIRVVHNGNTAYGCTNDMTPTAVLDLAGAVSEAVKGNEWNKGINFTKRSAKTLPIIKIRPDGVPLENKAGVVTRANRCVWGIDKRVLQASISYKDSIRRIEIANSLGEIVGDEKIDMSFVVVVVATDGKIIQTGAEVRGAFAGFEFFEQNPPEKVAEIACRRALIMLAARPAPTGPMPVVLSGEAGGTMVHEAVGHGLEADLIQGGFSVYRARVGQMVASPLVTVIDDATIPGKRGTFTFDDEGIPAQKTILIEKGVLKGFMHTRITAERSGQSPTGNGRRESYRFRPAVRMTNTIIQPKGDDPELIIKGTDHGLFVKKMGGGQVNTIRGDFVFEVQEGYLIKNGKITDPIRGATLTGNGPDVLKHIDRVGNDLGYAIGTCGKEGQAVPVANAQPTIRIPELVIGGTAS